MLATLRSKGIFVFLASNHAMMYIEQMMWTVIGEDWQDFFDMIISDVKKPLW